MFLVALILVALLLYLGSRKPRGYPPGPPRLPVLGIIPFLESHLIHKHFWRLSDTYGPVVGVYFGMEPVVIVNGWEAVKETLNNDDLIGRPNNEFSDILYGEQKGVMFVEGDLWKEQRRFTLHQFRNLGFAKRSHESVIHEELDELIKDIKETKESIHVQSLLGVSAINILWALMGGQRLDKKDEKLRYLVDKLNQLFRAGDVTGGITNILPALRHVQPKDSRFNTVLEGFRRVQDFIKIAVKEHKETLDPDNPRDFIDIYINEVNKNKDNPDNTFTDEQLLAVCTDVFSAGVETGSSTVSFAILLATLYPKVAQAIQKELDEVVGHGRLPSMEDRPKLVYTDAVMNEAFRFRGAAPLTVPHKAVRDTTIQGHRVPAKTMVTINLYSVHMDQEYWGDPENFRPERFINPDGSIRRDERLIPFGKGRRVCLGESLARMTSFVMFTSMMQHFTFKLDPSLPVTNTEGKSGFTLGPPQYRVFVEPRF